MLIKSILITLTILNIKLYCFLLTGYSSVCFSKDEITYNCSNSDSGIYQTEPVTDTIDVRASYFKKPPDIITSYINADNDEIRKAPGAMEDIIRFFNSSPGVSIGSDINNELIVRGGSPVENLNIVDGLILQNPNHYGSPGSTNGLLSYINLKLVKNIDFLSGGFPPEYGDRLSSVMNIKLRDGDFFNHKRDIHITAIGFGGFIEGPLFKNTSYMLSVRRSYYELLRDFLNTQLIPTYWDVNAKLSFNPSQSDNFSITGLFADDNASPFEEGDFMYDTINVKILSVGINYEKLISGNKINLTAGYVKNSYKVNYQNFILDINDNELSFAQKFELNINRNYKISLFANARDIFSEYFIYHGSGFNASNYYTPSVSVNAELRSYKMAGGFNIISGFLNKRLNVNAGLRVDKFNLLEYSTVFSPRIGIAYWLYHFTSINFNAGLNHQAPEMLWVIADTDNRKLKYIKMFELVLGTEHFFSKDVKLTFESYLKQYYDYPVSVYDPNYIFINSGVEIYPNFLDKAVSAGKGFFNGIDLTIQKKNSGEGLFGTISYSFSRSKFLALKGDIQPAEFDYGNQVTFIAGYKFKFGLILSSRFKFAKGRPYTPFDVQESAENNRGIYNTDLYNKARMPDYARLDLRIEYNASWKNFSLNAYLEILNLLNRVNYYNYYWSSFYQAIKSNLQLPRVPVLGLSVKF